MEKLEPISVSRGLKEIIDQAIEDLPVEERNNKFSICEKVADTLERRYIGDPDSPEYSTKKAGVFDYQLKRMGVETTKKLMQRIELYMLTKVRKSAN